MLEKLPLGIAHVVSAAVRADHPRFAAHPPIPVQTPACIMALLAPLALPQRPIVVVLRVLPLGLVQRHANGAAVLRSSHRNPLTVTQYRQGVSLRCTPRRWAFAHAKVNPSSHVYRIPLAALRAAFRASFISRASLSLALSSRSLPLLDTEDFRCWLDHVIRRNVILRVDFVVPHNRHVKGFNHSR